MKPVTLLTAVLSLPLESLEMFQVVISDKITNLQADAHKASKVKKQAEQIALGFSKEVAQLMPGKRGPKPKYDEAVLAYIRKHPGCSGPEIRKVVGLTDGSYLTSITNRLREQGHIRSEGTYSNTRWFPSV